MNELPTFGEYLTEIMRRKHISVSDLARRLNYRSRTSLSRLMRDETRYDSIEDFMHRIEPVAAWLLTTEEMQRLKQSMEVSRLGRARFQAYESMWKLIGAPNRNIADTMLRRCPSGDVIGLRELAQQWKTAASVEMVIVNSGCEALFGEIEEMFSARPDADIRVSHYMLVRSAPGMIAQQLGALMGIFHDPRYQGYYRTWNSDGNLFAENVHNNMAAIKGRRSDGSEFMQLLVIREEGMSLLYENDHDVALMDFFREVIKGICEGAMPLKTEYPQQDVIEGLITICRRYLNCEKDRTTCCLAPDICFELIPHTLLKTVMFDSALRGCDENDPQAAELIDIHRARYENIRSKRKKTVFIFSWAALKRFARTGCTTDHVCGMRAFTAQERIAILKDVIEQCRSNVYLSLHILHADLNVRGMTLTTHEGLGAYLLDSNTQYDVVRGHSEAFILMPEFAATLADFLRNELIEKHAYSEAESIDMLRSLITSINE